MKDTYNNLAIAEAAVGNVSLALKTYNKMIKKFPDDADTYLRYCRFLASILNQPGFTNKLNLQIQDVTSICIKSIELSPDLPEPLETLGAVYTLMAMYKEGIQTTETWLEKFEDKVDLKHTISVKSNFALTLLRSGNYQKAWKVSKEVMDVDGGSYRSVNSAANIRSIGWPLDKVAWELSEKGIHLFAKTLTIQDSNICASGQWRVALNYSDEISSNLNVTLINSETAYRTYGDINDPTFVGEKLPIYPKFWHERYMYLIHFKKAYMAGHSGVIFNNCTIYAGMYCIVCLYRLTEILLSPILCSL